MALAWGEKSLRPAQRRPSEIYGLRTFFKGCSKLGGQYCNDVFGPPDPG